MINLKKYEMFTTRNANKDIQVVNKKTHEDTPYDYYIGRPNPIGNPFSHLPHSTQAKKIVSTRDEAIDEYEKWFYEKIEKRDPVIMEEIQKMKDFYNMHGKINLLCWCVPKRCHGDVIRDYLIKNY